MKQDDRQKMALTRRGLMAGMAPALLSQTRPTRNGATVTLVAKPEPIKFTPASAAVIVVDMQNDFGSKGGMLESRWHGHLDDPTSGWPVGRRAPKGGQDCLSQDGVPAGSL